MNKEELRDIEREGARMKKSKSYKDIERKNQLLNFFRYVKKSNPEDRQLLEFVDNRMLKVDKVYKSEEEFLKEFRGTLISEPYLFILKNEIKIRFNADVQIRIVNNCDVILESVQE